MHGNEQMRLRMKTNTLELVALPELGGKIASLRHAGVELLQAPLRPYATRTQTMGFDQSDASGFDECLPSVAACELPDGTPIPDHGELWRLQCDAEQPEANELRLTATCSVLPLRMTRRLTLNDNTLRVDYRLENIGNNDLPYLWSAHPLFAVDEGDVVQLPASVTRVRLEGSAQQRLGSKGSEHSWPLAELPSGGKADLSRAGKPGDGIGDKLSAPAPREGWAAIDRRQHGLRVRVEFDPQRTPYLGLWLCYGGWPEGQLARQQCVALEPCTAPCDSLAEAMEKGWARQLSPGQSDSWWMTISVTDCNK